MIEQTEVDGVPTLIAPTVGGVTRAGLTFRVGRADEPLARSGITHIVEHLALHQLNMSDYHFNGTTGLITTDFHLEGSEADITGYLTAVCAALSDLPFARLETEKEILRTEQSSRTSSVLQPFHLWRYGARSYGVSSYPEWGLSMLGPDDVRAWVSRFFTRENAVLWVTGRVPPGLKLQLPYGQRQPIPVPTSALPAAPAFFYGDSRAVAVESIVPRSTVGTIFAGVLERELFRALRQEGGLSYTAAATYEPRGDAYATIMALADALPSKQDAVLGGFVDVLAKLRVGRIDPADLAAVVGRSEDVLNRSDVDAQRLPGAAVNLLTGHPNKPVDQLLAEVRAVTPADLHAMAQEAMSTALLMAPSETSGAEWAGFTPAPTTSESVIIGERHPSVQGADTALVVGPEGVSSVTDDGAATVRFDECAVMLMWPDGARQLIGNDGIGVRFEPTLVELGPAARARIDAGVAPGAQVQLPARDPRSIPQPRPAEPAATVPAAPQTPWTVPAPPAPSRRRSLSNRVALYIVGVLAIFLTVVAALATVGTLTDPEAGDWGSDAAVWVVAVLLWLPTVALWRRR